MKDSRWRLQKYSEVLNNSLFGQREFRLVFKRGQKEGENVKGRRSSPLKSIVKNSMGVDG